MSVAEHLKLVLESHLPVAMGIAAEHIQFERFICRYPQQSSGHNLTTQMRDALIRLFTDTGNDWIAGTFKQLGEQACANGIPSANITTGIHLAKERLNRFISNETDYIASSYMYIAERVNTARMYIAKGYLSHDVESLNAQMAREFARTDYFVAHASWVRQISVALIEEDPARMPELASTSCPLHHWLQEPETTLILSCDDDRAVVTSLHDDLHHLAANIGFFIPAKDYFQLSELFRELARKSMHFLHLLNDYYSQYQANRTRIFLEYVVKNRTATENGYLCVININKLGITNKLFGQDSGNRLLEDMETLLKREAAKQKTHPLVTRGHSGEFYLYFTGCPNACINEFVLNVSRQLERLKEQVQYDVVTTKVSTAAIRIDPNVPIDVQTLQQLLSYALMRARQAPGGTLLCDQAFNTELITQLRTNVATVREVQLAIEQDMIEPFFQPVVDLNTNQLFDIEALARLKTGNGYSPAGKFIDTIFELDAVIALDLLMLDHITNYSLSLRHLTDTIFINVSPLTLASPSYLDRVHVAIDKFQATGITPVFELTEQAFLNNLNLVKHLSEHDKISFAVDDFGTGYSSLKMVADLSDLGVIKYLKIDGSLTRSLGTSTTVRHMFHTICHMAKHLNLKTVAEFIENDQIKSIARASGANYGQGYLYDPPLHIDALTEKYLHSS